MFCKIVKILLVCFHDNDLQYLTELTTVAELWFTTGETDNICQLSYNMITALLSFSPSPDLFLLPDIVWKAARVSRTQSDPGLTAEPLAL